jgi:hypothetical protein
MSDDFFLYPILVILLYTMYLARSLVAHIKIASMYFAKVYDYISMHISRLIQA